MPYFLFDHQKNFTNPSKLKPITEEVFFNGINNYRKRKKLHQKELKKINVNLKKEVYFSSFKRKHILSFLSHIENTNNEDYFVLRFASKIGRISKDHHSFMTPVLMKKNTCEIEDFMCRGGRRGKQLGPKSDRDSYCNSAIGYWDNRNDIVKNTDHFENECSGIAHLALDVKELLSCKDLQGKYVNFIMMYSPVAKLGDRTTEFKTTFAFYLSDNRSKSEIKVFLRNYEAQNGFMDYTTFKAEVDPYDNGHECCPI
ncbi:hypothetical protein [Jiulongibacter sediminis]|uniref:Uncharacterized protein n=1 Tax=Jiulongibacter sediminis TaxID=1605367 RepID=A0A0P7C1J7_9BACT|nr:hypothetical protein [Jiulongibacter sediminis]KPM47883.1 hypothetical protein AFM12_11645 [Jiulongibacter sediminis]TBX24066.1 hypothetical protein TK44_11655 [Jiulongibacter sediminis]